MATVPNSSEFRELLSACQELSEGFPDGLVYIGGIAVYLHAINSPAAERYAEFTHDADFYISLSDMADLRDLEELTPNRRLNKHQLIKRGFEFDIYTERYSALIVPYDVVLAHCVSYESIRVAALEHLLVLKLEAYRDRRASAKGSKDAHDLFRIGLIANQTPKSFDPDLAAPYLREEHIELVEQVIRGPESLALAAGNSKTAKEIRSALTVIKDQLERVV